MTLACPWRTVTVAALSVLWGFLMYWMNLPVYLTAFCGRTLTFMAFCYMLCIPTIPMASANSPAQPSNHTPSNLALTFTSIKAVEGSRFFSLDINYRLKGKGMDYSAHWKSRVDADVTASFIQITPHVDVQIIPSPEAFRLVGSFAPGTRYSIHIRAGLEDNQHAWLRKSRTLNITTPSFAAKMNFLSKARYLPRMDGMELPFEYRNVDHARIKVLRVPPQNLVFWMSQTNGRYASDEVAEEVLNRDIQLTMKQNKQQRSAVDLSPLKHTGKGVYEVQLFRLQGKKNREHEMDASLIVVTDLAAIAKQSGQDLHIWTRSAGDFSKKTDVQVRVMSYNNFEIARCTTDIAGACVLQGVMKQKKKPYALILSTDDDLSYLRFSDVALDNGDAKQLRPYDNQATALESYVYSSRGVYRPGETVDLAAITWTGDHQAAKSVPLQWKILTPRQQVLREISERSSSFGMSTLQLRLNDYATTGKYQVILSSGKKQLGTMGFFVEEFMPERIALKVEAKQPWVVAKNSANFELDARYLFGPAVDGGQYQARFSLQPAWYSIPNHPGFSTGAYQLNHKAAIMLPPSMGTLDVYGHASISAATRQLSASFPTVMKLTARVDVNEAGSGRMTHREQSMLVAAQAELLGLHSISHDNGVVHFEGRTFNPEGEAMPTQGKVKLSLWQLYSNWSYSWNPETDSDEWHAERLLMPTGTEDSANLEKGQFTARLPLTEEWGEYIVRATMANGQIADLPVTVGYPWYWGHAGKDSSKPPAPDQLRLQASHSEAKAGDAVEFSFEAPFAGQALFTLESDHVLYSHWLTVNKGMNSIPVAAPDVLPNVYAAVLLIKDPREGAMYIPARAWGTTSLRMIPQPYIAGVTMNAPQTMRPDRDLVIHLQSDDHQPAEFSLAAVDEGILQLTRFKTPDPIDYFFAPRRSGVTTFETIGWTFPRSMKRRYTRTGGGMAAKAGGGRVIPVRLVSYWSGIIRSDATGAAEVRVPVPPFQGKLRLMAVAAQQGKVGHAEQFTTVSDPLVLQPTLPRFMQQGDTFEIPVFVVNTTGQAHDVKVSLTAGDGVNLARDHSTIHLAAMASNTVYFPATVTALAGAVNFTFQAQSGTLVSHDRARIPVLPANSEQTVNITPPVGKPFTLASYLPDSMLSEGLKLSVTASSLPYIAELKRVRELIHYPYGCIEQTTSSMMPLLYVEPLLATLAPDDSKKPDDIKAMVEHGINRLLGMQTNSGGFGYWAGDNSPVLWGSAYATHGLLAAKAKGYDVPESALNDALNFLQTSITSQRDHWRKGNHHYYDAEAYMVYILGLAGRHQKQRIRTLAEKTVSGSGHDLEDYFLIMMAAQMAGNKALADQLLQKHKLFSLVKSGARSSEGGYWSPLRSDAMRLSLAEDLWPDDTRLEPLRHSVAQRMLQQSHLNTQETAWSISALGKIVSRHPPARMKGVELWLNGHPITADHGEKNMPTWLLSGSQLNASSALELRYKGKNRPFLSATLIGYSKTQEATANASEVLAVQREYLDMTGNPLDSKAIEHGQLLQVRLSVRNLSHRQLRNVALVDRLPAGFELENSHPKEKGKKAGKDKDNAFTTEHVDRRDDRIQVFGNLTPMQRINSGHYTYTVRAVSKGTFTAPPSKLELMYEPDIYSLSESSSVHIR